MQSPSTNNPRQISSDFKDSAAIPAADLPRDWVKTYDSY